MDADKIFVIVDAFSSGNQLAPEILRRAGWSCLHVQSSNRVPDFLYRSYREEDFIESIIHETVDKTLSEIASYNPSALIAGCEMGVELADQLGESLNLLTNGTLKSKARRNKYNMHEVLRSTGQTLIKQKNASSLQELKTWIEEQNLTRVVLKPCSSFCTDSVFFCETEEQVETAFNKIIGSENLLLEKNVSVLAQNRLEGPEFYVNTVSYQGSHKITDIWRYKLKNSNGNPFVCDREVLLPYGGNAQEQLIPYTFRVLDSLEITNGPAHCEIILTPQGPSLVEVGARLCGGGLPALVKECTGGSNQVTRTVDVYTDPERFLESCKNTGYKIEKNATALGLIAEKPGTFKEFKNLDSIRSMSSYYREKLFAKPGDTISPTGDYFSCPAQFDLIHENADIVQSDADKIRRLEESGQLYDIV